MKFIDLFSGVGAVEMALKELGIDFKILYCCDESS